MISLYGVAGRLFNGRLDELRRVRPVAGKPRADAWADAEADFHLSLTQASQLGDGPADAPPRGAPANAHGAQAGAIPEGLGAYRAAARPPRVPLGAAGELMSRPALTLAEGMGAREAWLLLAQRRVSQAPVIGAAGGLVGLAGWRELAPGPEVTEGARHWLQPVGRLMRTPVPAVAPDTDLRQVAQAMLMTGLPGLAVVDEAGAVLGFISRTDLLRGIARDPPLDLWA